MPPAQHGKLDQTNAFAFKFVLCGIGLYTTNVSARPNGKFPTTTTF